MNICSKMPLLELVEQEIVRQEMRAQQLMQRRANVQQWMFADYVNRRDRANITIARLNGAIKATCRGARASHLLYMQMLEV